MAFRRIHLNKSGAGFSSKTACGRNLLCRAAERVVNLSTDWAGFTGTMQTQRCERCNESSFAAFMRKNDWEPEAPDAGLKPTPN